MKVIYSDIINLYNKVKFNIFITEHFGFHPSLPNITNFRNQLELKIFLLSSTFVQNWSFEALYWPFYCSCLLFYKMFWNCWQNLLKVKFLTAKEKFDNYWVVNKVIIFILNVYCRQLKKLDKEIKEKRAELATCRRRHLPSR